MAGSRPDPLGVRAYLERDWNAVAEQANRDWQIRQRARTPAERVAVSEGLRDWAHAVRPDLPWAELRKADLESHTRVAALLRRADARLAI